MRFAIPLVLLALFASSRLDAQEMPEITKLEARAAKAGEHAAGFRELPLRRKVDVAILERDRHAELLVRETERAFGGDLDDVEAFLARFGFIPRKLKLRTALTVFAIQAVGASYDQGTIRLFDAEASDAQLVHEMTHALQDQNFAWDSQAEQASGLDAMIAFQSLVEGDAELVERSFVDPDSLKDADALARLLRWETEVEEAAARANVLTVPAVFSRSQTFWYTRGEEFVFELHRKGGWAAVNRAWGSPPETTEQVLHPEKYLAREHPVRLDTSGLEAALIADGWAIRYASTAGELLVEIWLEQRSPRPLDVAACFKAAAGWGGDRAILAERRKDRLGIWVTTWDTPEDAAEFFAAARRNLRGDDLGEDTADRAVRDASDGRQAVARRGADVLLVLGSPGSTMGIVEREAWKSTQIVPVEKK
ncbi:MAG: hypothetical protein HYY18_03075 [Planctomycetes bacterium]|nr:hypothetical protein [Planctomycetota bacterium]